MNLLGRRDAFLFSIYKISMFVVMSHQKCSMLLTGLKFWESHSVAFLFLIKHCVTFLFNFYFPCYLNQFFSYFFFFFFSFFFFCFIVFVFFFFCFIVFPRVLFDFDRHENYPTIDSCFHSCIAILLITEYQNFIQ